MRELVDDAADEIENLKDTLTPEEFAARVPEIVDRIKRQWRAQVGDDSQLTEEFYQQFFRYADELPEELDPKAWIYDEVPESGVPGLPAILPSEALGRPAPAVDARFINDGTVSIQFISDLEEATSSEQMMAWLYSGYGDNATQYSRATVDIPFAAARLKDKMVESSQAARVCRRIGTASLRYGFQDRLRALTVRRKRNSPKKK